MSVNFNRLKNHILNDPLCDWFDKMSQILNVFVPTDYPAINFTSIIMKTKKHTRRNYRMEHFMDFVQTFAKHTVFTTCCKSYKGQQDFRAVMEQEKQQIRKEQVVIDGNVQNVMPVGRNSTQVHE